MCNQGTTCTSWVCLPRRTGTRTWRLSPAHRTSHTAPTTYYTEPPSRYASLYMAVAWRPLARHGNAWCSPTPKATRICKGIAKQCGTVQVLRWACALGQGHETCGPSTLTATSLEPTPPAPAKRQAAPSQTHGCRTCSPLGPPLSRHAARHHSMAEGLPASTARGAVRHGRPDQHPQPTSAPDFARRAAGSQVTGVPRAA